MSNVQSEAYSYGRRSGRSVPAVIAAAVIAVLAWAARDNEVRENVCQWQAVPIVCASEYKNLDDDEARELVHRFFERAAVGRTDRASAMLVGDAVDQYNNMRADPGWQQSAWAEILSFASAEDRNTYKVEVKHYMKDARDKQFRDGTDVKVEIAFWDVKAQHGTAGPRISEVLFDQKADEWTTTFPRLEVVSAAHTYRRPIRDLRLVTSQRAEDITVGGSLTAICSYEDHNRSASWIRIAQGWMPRSSFDLGDAQLHSCAEGHSDRPVGDNLT
ncbi:MAG TPA: hypothetical protein VFZ70_00390 [Euzebyales bacterium]